MAIKTMTRILCCALLIQLVLLPDFSIHRPTFIGEND